MIIGATAGVILHQQNREPALPDTGEVLASMLSENTGASILDSGGAYGRHWERNQGMGKAEWEALPSGFLMDGEWPVIRTYHFLNDRLMITKESEALNREYRAIYEADDEVMNADHETVLERMGHESGGDYTYNCDNLLTQDFVFTDFEVNWQWFTVISTHNGCDARGGFSKPYVFEIRGSTEYWAHDISEAHLWCNTCAIQGQHGYFSDGSWWYTGDYPETLPGMGEPDRERQAPEGWEPGHGCFQCQGELEVGIVEGGY